jgi:hypothetical protein
VHASAVACLNEQFDVGVHEWNGHSYRSAVWEDEVGVLAESFDSAKDVVPAAAIETGAVVTELVNDLCHALEIYHLEE